MRQIAKTAALALGILSFGMAAANADFDARELPVRVGRGIQQHERDVEPPQLG